MRHSRLSLSNSSRKHRLPLLTGVPLLGIIRAQTWASYRRAKEPAIRTVPQSPAPTTRTLAPTLLLRQLTTEQDLKDLQLQLWSVHKTSLTIPDRVSPEPADLESARTLCAADLFRVRGLTLPASKREIAEDA
jgi:hypothetical protein